MAFTNPTVADFKTRFYRDFPYGTDPEVAILDQDIAVAFQDTNLNFETNMWPDQATYTNAYLFMSAHYLVMNIRSSSQGINGQFQFNQQSVSAGPVSESFAIPQAILNHPIYGMYAKTNYGQRFLQYLLLNSVGQMFTVPGRTKP